MDRIAATSAVRTVYALDAGTGPPRSAAGFLTMEKVRHQLFLPRPLSDRLEAIAAVAG